MLQGTTVCSIVLLLPVQRWEPGCLSVGRGDGAYTGPWCSGERVSLHLHSILGLVISDLSIDTDGGTLLVCPPSFCMLVLLSSVFVQKGVY